MAQVGLLLLFIGVGVCILVYGMRLRARRNERLAQLYEKAIAAGIDPRSVQLDFESREAGDPFGNLKAGIILLAVALAIVLGIWASATLQGAYKLLGFALVPALLGLAVLFIHFTVPHSKPDQAGKPKDH